MGKTPEGETKKYKNILASAIFELTYALLQKDYAMIFEQKELSLQLKEQLKDYVYDIVVYLFKVYKELPCGYPEYVYQEAVPRCRCTRREFTLCNS